MRPENIEYERDNGNLVLRNNTGSQWVYNFTGIEGAGGILGTHDTVPVPETITPVLFARMGGHGRNVRLLAVSLEMFHGLRLVLDREA